MGRPKKSDKVEIIFKNGERVTLEVKEFDIDIGNIGKIEGQINAQKPHKFSYTAPGGEEKPLYLTLNEVAGIVVRLG